MSGEAGAGSGAVTQPLLERCRFLSGELLCAVSGGADSAALLALAVSTGQPVRAFHIDHGLRPQGPDEARRVTALSSELGVECEIIGLRVAAGPNLEARARAARYAALPRNVLTGHTADDLAETVLLQLLRGGALDALASMSPVGRPILGLRRSETEAVCDAIGYTPVEDPSNADARFRRNRIRHEVLPLLAEVMQRDTVPLLARAASLAGEERLLLDSLAAGLDPTDAKSLREAPLPLARRAVRKWLRGEHPPDAAAVDQVLEVARGDRVATEIVGGRRVRRSGGRLELLASGGDNSPRNS